MAGYTERMSVSPAIRIYVDLEYCYPGMTKASGRPCETDKRQVVQIAAIRFDDQTGEEMDSFNQLVIPAYEVLLPPFFEELTAITQADVDREGIAFPEALQAFVNFCKDDPIFTFDKDWYVLQQNAGYHGMSFPYADRPFVRVKALLPGWGVNPDDYSSGTLYKAAGLQMSGHVHNALHDVRSMAHALHSFTARG